MSSIGNQQISRDTAIQSLVFKKSWSAGALSYKETLQPGAASVPISISEDGGIYHIFGEQATAVSQAVQITLDASLDFSQYTIFYECIQNTAGVDTQLETTNLVRGTSSWTLTRTGAAAGDLNHTTIVFAQLVRVKN